MKKDNTDFIVSIITFILCIVITLMTQACSTTISMKTYNNGIHKKCGGHWVYENAVGHRYSTNYIYHCDKCGKVYEFVERY